MIELTFDEVVTFKNIYLAHKKGRLNKRDKLPLVRFESDMLARLYGLYSDLRSGKFRIYKYQFFIVNEPKRRQIQTQPYPVRVVQHLLCDLVLAPYFTAHAVIDNCVCQVGKGSHFALDRLEANLRRHISEHGTSGYFLKLDILKYFPTMPHEGLKKVFCSEVRDERLRGLLEYIIDSFSTDEKFLQRYSVPPLPAEEGTGRGIPIGNQTSQIFGMFYLNDLDRLIKEKLRVKVYSRYMDDAVLVFCDKEEAQAALKVIRQKVASLGLFLNDKTQIFPLKNGVTYLGFRFKVTEEGKIIKTVTRKTRTRLRSRTKLLKKAYLENYIDSERVRASLAAFHGHLGHGNCFRLERELDGKLRAYAFAAPNGKIK